MGVLFSESFLARDGDYMEQIESVKLYKSGVNLAAISFITL